MARVTRTRWITTTKQTDRCAVAPHVEEYEEVTIRTGPSDGITAWRITDLADAMTSEGCPGSAKVDASRDSVGCLTALSVKWKTKIEHDADSTCDGQGDDDGQEDGGSGF